MNGTVKVNRRLLGRKSLELGCDYYEGDKIELAFLEFIKAARLGNLEAHVGDLDLVVSSIENNFTKKTYVKITVDLIAAVAFDLIAPIVQEYPELDPYKANHF